MLTKRSMLIYPLLLAVVAYTAGVVEYAHLRLDGDGPNYGQCMAGLVTGSDRLAGYSDGTTPASPVRRQHSHKDCPVCQALSGLQVLSLASWGPSIQSGLLIARTVANDWRPPARDVPSDSLARAPPLCFLS